MVNTSAKGAGLERQAMDELEAEGYLVHRAVRNPIFHPKRGFVGSHNNDVFGAFDLLATDEKLGFRCIQVTVGDKVAERMEKVRPVARRLPPLITAEVWGWVGGAKRVDARFKNEKRFIRRQYWRRFVWHHYVPEEFGPGWVDVTKPDDGWKDHGGKAPGVDDGK